MPRPKTYTVGIKCRTKLHAIFGTPKHAYSVLNLDTDSVPWPQFYRFWTTGLGIKRDAAILDSLFDLWLEHIGLKVPVEEIKLPRDAAFDMVLYANQEEPEAGE